MPVPIIAAAAGGAGAAVWPIAMLSQGLCTIMNIANQRDLAKKNQEFQERLEKGREAFQRETFEKTAALQRELTVINHDLRLLEQKQAFENIMQQIEFQYFMQNWPLIIPPFVMRDETIIQNDDPAETRVGLRVILTKSSNPIFNKYIYDSIEHGLFMFVNKYYNSSGSSPVLFYSGGWKNATGGGGAVNSMLHYALKKLPTLIIDPEIVNNTLHFDIALWGLGVEPFRQDTILNMPFEYKVEKNIVDESYYREYAEAFQRFVNYAVGWIADIYNLLEYNQLPQLPQIISKELNSDEQGIAMRDYFARKYMSIYEYILRDKNITVGGTEFNLSYFKKCIQPDLCLEFQENSHEIMKVYPAFDSECIHDSMSKWLELRGVATDKKSDAYLLNDICKVSEKIDIDYLNKLKDSYTILRSGGDSNAAHSISVLNRRIVWLK